MPSTSAYLFIEFAILVYAIGFGWEYWDLKRLMSREFLAAALGLALLWFLLDQTAVWLGLWSFPEGGTLPIRIFALPIEEYIIFFLHTLVCFVLVNRYLRNIE
jgi:lycopene cyclase domain-containing protein